MNYFLLSNVFKTCEDQAGVTTSLITYKLQHLLMYYKKQSHYRPGQALRVPGG
jgi:hypothetical protein